MFGFKENFKEINILSFKQKYLYQHDILVFLYLCYDYLGLFSEHCLKNQGKKKPQNLLIVM